MYKLYLYLRCKSRDIFKPKMNSKICIFKYVTYGHEIENIQR